MKIIIPMTGRSMRFKLHGIETPKQFLEIENREVYKHIVDMFPGEDDINFIVNKEDYKNKALEKYFLQLKDFKITEIDYQQSGPGGALLESGLLETNEPILINYCDFANIWDWKEFNKFIQTYNPDGVLPAYSGLHPHSIYGNDYAFLKLRNKNVIGIQEKKPYTNNKMYEYASTGAYYFKSGVLAKKYLLDAFELKEFTNGEMYVSSVFRKMITDKLKILHFEINHFFQWGTPEDYLEFKYNLEEVRNFNSKKKIDIEKINLIIPAAGESKRFREKNYKQSKIYLKINKYSILENIINCFSNNKFQQILIQKKDFIEKIKFTKDKDIVKISNKTASQAESAFILINEIQNDYPVLIHSADCILDKNTKIDTEDCDIIVYTKENYRRAFFDYQNYGWVNSKNKKIKNLRIKKKPISFDSNVIVGVFLFKNKEVYKNIYNDTILNLSNKNIEIHIDYLIKTALKKGYKIKEVSSRNTIMLGTPVEYELFKYMQFVSNYINK